MWFDLLKKINLNRNFIREFLKNAYKFSIMMLFILAYIKIFGDENTLIGVSIYVGLAMFPVCDSNMKRSSMLLVIAIVLLVQDWFLSWTPYHLGYLFLLIFYLFTW